MKTKLQALIEEQKALTAKFEELLNSTTEESSTLDPKKVYIKGHPTRGAEVIKMLEDLGGVNDANLKGQHNYEVYYITPKGHISIIQLNDAMADYTELHLPEEVNEVDPPTEEVELIEGEVYACDWFIFIYKKTNQGYNTVQAYVDLCIDNDYIAYNSTGVCSIDEISIATPEQRQQLFDALEKAGKCFDEESLSLIDVEEWSCEKGLPVIVRNDTTNWKVDIFHSYDKIDKRCPFSCATCDIHDRLYKYAIPYTEENTYFIGTTNSPDKHYKFVSKKKLNRI